MPARRWTPEEDEELRRLWLEGLTVGLIVRRMPGRRRTSIWTRSVKLGLFQSGAQRPERKKLRASDVKREKAAKELSLAQEAVKVAEVERRLRIRDAGYGKTVAEVVALLGYPADEVERELKYLVRGGLLKVRDGRHWPPHEYERGRKAS